MTSMKPESLTVMGYIVSFVLCLLLNVTWTYVILVLANIMPNGEITEFIWSHMFDK
jgi:hypothetical protein